MTGPKSQDEINEYISDQMDEGSELNSDQRGKNASAYDTVELRALEDWDAAIALAERVTGTVEDASKVIGTGFRVLPTAEKKRLVGIPFVILAVDFNLGDNGEFCSFLAFCKYPVAEYGQKLVVNDGSTGIYNQLSEWALLTQKERKGGLRVEGGLRESEYDKRLDNGEMTHAITYYLNV